MKRIGTTIAASVLAIAGLTSGSASAATILASSDFLIEGQTTNGNCPTSERPCVLLNPGANSTVTLSIGGGVFDLDSFFYSFQGTNSQLTATSSTGGSRTISRSQSLTSGFSDLRSLDGFQNINNVVFSNTGNSTIRIGGFAGTTPAQDSMPSAVPLPASSLLLLAGLGGLVTLRKRKG